MKLPLPRVACPHSTSAATTSRPKPCPCALSLSQRPSSGETESASSNEAMPRHSLLSSRRMTKENLFGSGACTLFSHRVTYSLHDGGSHGMNLAMAGVMHPKTSCASFIWNWLSCNRGDWMTIIVSSYQRWIIRQLIAGETAITRLTRRGVLWVYQQASLRFQLSDDPGVYSLRFSERLRIVPRGLSLLSAAPRVRHFRVIEQLIELGTVQPLSIYENRIDLVHIRNVRQRISIQQDHVGRVAGRNTAPGFR